LWGTPAVFAEGIKVTARTKSHNVNIVPDGSNGAIVVWLEGDSTSSYRIFAQKLNASGVKQWGASDVTVSNRFVKHSFTIQTCSDSAGGAFIFWSAKPSGGPMENRLAHVNAGGTLTAPGVNGIKTGNKGEFLRLIRNGSGAYAAWYDFNHIRVQRIQAGFQWGANGIAVAKPTSVKSLDIAEDSTGGLLVCWGGTLSGGAIQVRCQRYTSAVVFYNTHVFNSWNIAASHIAGDGSVGYSEYVRVDGVPPATSGLTQWYPSIANDFSGPAPIGIVACWPEEESSKLFAQKVALHATPPPSPEWMAISITIRSSLMQGEVIFT
jgi:hypothetical protein